MHRIYSSEAIVLHSRSYGEADTIVSLFTKEYGCMRAIAKSSRREVSKLRYSLRDHSVTLASLVRGKELWRITNAVFVRSYRPHGEYRKVASKVSMFLTRLMPPEHAEPFLYEIYGVFLALAEQGETDPRLLETGMVLHILRSLGYLEERPEFADFLRKPLTQEGIAELAPYKKVALDAINNALRHSHL